MTSNQQYDAVVIGAGAGGLFTAARLAHQGYRTLVVEALDKVGGRASTTEVDGFKVNDGAIVIDLSTMKRVSIDPAARIARVQPGAFLGDFKRELAGHGLLFAPDPTSEEESSLGGAVACNASGARSLKYGATRRHVVGLTVVLANGEVDIAQDFRDS